MPLNIVFEIYAFFDSCLVSKVIDFPGEKYRLCVQWKESWARNQEAASQLLSVDGSVSFREKLPCGPDVLGLRFPKLCVYTHKHVYRLKSWLQVSPFYFLDALDGHQRFPRHCASLAFGLVKLCVLLLDVWW